MRLNLTPFQHPAPYPILQNVTADRELAQALQHAYSGEKSELTTILQYAHHSLNCKETASEYSNILRGIFYVETIHMDLLGNCIRRLGGDTNYTLSFGEKTIGWQADMVNYCTTPAEMIQDDIRGEEAATKFYLEMAAKAKQQDISNLLNRLAEDEKLHQRMLAQICNSIL